MGELANKSVVITGAGHGIGRAIALEFAKAGAGVTIADIDDSSAESVAREIRSSGGRALPAQTDVSSKSQIDETLRQHVAEFQQLDILINNAGIAHVKPLLELTEEEWDRVFAVNLKSVLFGTQAAARLMIGRNVSGRIINIASVAGKGGRPLLAAYAASKAAVINFTQSAAHALAPHRITVNCVCPGYVGTTLGLKAVGEMKSYADSGVVSREQTAVPPAPLSMDATPEDVARMVTCLAGRAGDYVTGQAINVDGGRCMH